MRKYIYSLLLVIIILAVSAPLSAKEWYEGGTLHGATIAQWKRASRQNKMATRADWLSALYMRGNLNVSISGMDDLKRCSTAVVDYIDKASSNTRALDNETANSVALLGMMMAGLIKENGNTSNTRTVLVDPEPDIEESVDQKLKANGFLLDDEIDEIYEAEKTPDVLTKLTEAQQKAIVAELNEAKETNARESQKFGLGIKDSFDRSMYQDGVFNNKMLKARRAIAKKYGIQAGDISTIELSIASAK